MKFFDANLYIGLPTTGAYKSVTASTDLLELMDELEIEKALVWHFAQFDSSPQDGNKLISEFVAGQDRLLGCWTILPPQTEEVICKDFFSKMAENNIAALRAFPGHHGYLLNRTVFGAFLDEATERRVPLLLSLDHSVNWQVIYDLLKEYPNLICIICDIGNWGKDRYTWPLLEAYPNVYIETSYLSLEALGLETTVHKYGADRLVFGSAYPKRYPEAAILDLIHADISESDKRKIAFENLAKLLGSAL